MGERDIKYTVAAEDKFGRVFGKLKQDLGSVREHSDTALSAIGKLNAGLGVLAFGLAAGGAGLVGGLKTLSRDLAALSDASEAIGDSVEKISGIEDVARRNGEGLDLVTTAALKLNRALSESDPNSATVQALKSIGLSAADLKRQSPVDALQTIAVALQRYSNDGDRARVIQELFGKSTKEVAGFLRDLAEAGKLNTTVTATQAEEAKKFNDQLSTLATNSNNAGRSIASVLIPKINELFDSFNKFGGLKGSLMARLGLDDMSRAEGRAQLLAADVARAGDVIDRMAEEARRDPDNELLKGRIDRARARLAVLMKEAQGASEAVKQLSNDVLGDPAKREPFSDARNDGLRRVGSNGAKTAPKAATEAERYLETLQKQGEKLQNLSVYEQALADIQHKRISGIEPVIQRSILAEAKLRDIEKLRDEQTEGLSRASKARLDALDAMKKENSELEKEVSVLGLSQAALVDIELARINAALATDEESVALQRKQGIDERQLQVLNEEIAARKKRKALLIDKVDKQAGIDGQADALDKIENDLRDKSSTGLEQGLLDGFRRGGNMADVFLNELKAQFAKTILMPIIRPIAQTGNNLIERMLGDIAGTLFGGGGGMNIDYGGYGIGNGTPTPTHGGLANGGRAKAGGVYRVNENGIETFQPDVNGTVLSNSQSRRQAQAQPVIHLTQVNHFNGDMAPQTIQAMQAMIARNNQQLLRSARTGGAFAT